MAQSSPIKTYNGVPDLFGAPPPPSYAPSIAKVRAEIEGVLETARTATEMPWPEKKVRYWKTVFPQMCNWLPAEEAAQKRAAFAAELSRLGAA